jgi:hypothetical protein
LPGWKPAIAIVTEALTLVDVHSLRTTSRPEVLLLFALSETSGAVSSKYSGYALRKLVSAPR